MRGRDGVRALFLAERPSLLRFFRRSTGSSAIADDLAQDAFLRLAAADFGALANPSAYLWRISANLVTDMNRGQERRTLTAAEVDDILEAPDPTPDPEARLIAKDAMERMITALAELPARRRHILLASRLESVPHRTLAERYAVSTRTIEIEIRKALEHCTRALLD